MTELFIGAISALWLGILTSVSPCPLTSNILAISFVSRRVDKPGKVLVAGFLYTLGRVLAYVVLGCALVFSLVAIPAVSQFLQKYMTKLLGPILIVAGMFLTNLLSFTPKGHGISDHLQKRVEQSEYVGSLLLGILFALSFCPISAALFFGSLIPTALKLKSAILLPAAYGIGTGIPVIIFALMIALGADWAGRAFDTVGKVGLWARIVTGTAFILVGIYMSLAYIFGVFG